VLVHVVFIVSFDMLGPLMSMVQLKLVLRASVLIDKGTQDVCMLADYGPKIARHLQHGLFREAWWMSRARSHGSLSEVL
jgi:predicted thioredoxin/glutaredoxin